MTHQQGLQDKNGKRRRAGEKDNEGTHYNLL